VFWGNFIFNFVYGGFIVVEGKFWCQQPR